MQRIAFLVRISARGTGIAEKRLSTNFPWYLLPALSKKGVGGGRSHLQNMDEDANEGCLGDFVAIGYQYCLKKEKKKKEAAGEGGGAGQQDWYLLPVWLRKREVGGSPGQEHVCTYLFR